MIKRSSAEILELYPAKLRQKILHLPQEVWERQVYYWSPWSLKFDFEGDPNDKLFSPDRLVYAAKAEVSRASTWARALKTGIAKCEEGSWGNGWRKCHTEHYWCYYAKYLPGEKDRRKLLIEEATGESKKGCSLQAEP